MILAVKWRRLQAAVFLSSLLFFPSILHCFFYCPLPLLFSFSLKLFFFPSVFRASTALSLLLFFFLLVSPVFIGKKQGGERPGRLLCCRPSTTQGAHLLPFLQHVESFGQVGVLGRRLFDAFKRKKIGENRGKKNLLLPLLHASRGRRRPTVSFKTAPFGLFFCEQCMKRRRFRQNASFQLKGKGGKNVSEFTLVLNL